MGKNNNCLEGWKCPNCGHTDSFKVEVTRCLTVTLYDNGTDDSDSGGGETTWENDSPAYCGECDTHATVAYFTGVEEASETPPIDFDIATITVREATNVLLQFALVTDKEGMLVVKGKHMGERATDVLWQVFSDNCRAHSFEPDEEEIASGFDEGVFEADGGVVIHCDWCSTE